MENRGGGGEWGSGGRSGGRGLASGRSGLFAYVPAVYHKCPGVQSVPDVGVILAGYGVKCCF